MNYRDLDEFVAKYGTQHNSDLPYKKAVNQVIRKDLSIYVYYKNKNFLKRRMA